MTLLLQADARPRDSIQDLYQAEFCHDQALAFMAGRLSIDPSAPEKGKAYLYYASPEKLDKLRRSGEVWEPTVIDVRILPGLWSRLLQDPALAGAKLAQLRLTFRTDTDGVVSWTLTDVRPLPPTGDAIFPDWINVQGQILMVDGRGLVVRIHAKSVAPFTLRLLHDGDIRFERRQRRWAFRLSLSKGRLRIHTATPIGKPLPEAWRPKPKRPKLRKSGSGPVRALGPARPSRPGHPSVRTR